MHQPPNIYIFIGRNRRNLRVNLCKVENFAKEVGVLGPNGFGARRFGMIGATY